MLPAHTKLSLGTLRPCFESRVPTACLVAVEFPHFPKQESAFSTRFILLALRKVLLLPLHLFVFFFFNLYSLFLENSKDKEEVWSWLVQSQKSMTHSYSKLIQRCHTGSLQLAASGRCYKSGPHPTRIKFAGTSRGRGWGRGGG